MLNDFYKDKKILVTGGSGSIGRKIVKELLKYDVDVVRVFDNNETALFNLEQDLPEDYSLRLNYSILFDKLKDIYYTLNNLNN